MGAGDFHGRVRDGIGCGLPAMATRSSSPSPGQPAASCGAALGWGEDGPRIKSGGKVLVRVSCGMFCAVDGRPGLRPYGCMLWMVG